MTTAVQQARDALGYRLRDIRMDARLSGRQLAALAGWHFTKISKIEHGRSMPSEADIELWCFHCGAESQIPDLIATLRGIERMYVELKRLLRAGTARYQQELLQQERKAYHLRSFDPAIVPGVLQAPGYATVRLPEFTDMVGIPADVEEPVAARMERGKLLLTGDRLFHVVLAEQALHAGLADPEVMKGPARAPCRGVTASEVGVGTTFTVTIPATAQAPAAPPTVEAYRRSSAGKTILVVEDEPALREVARRVLCRNGYQVITAANGPEAMEAARNHPGEIHLLVTDVIMPQMLGKEVAQEIRRIRPGIGVLFMSAYARPVLAAQGRLDPGAALLEKPFSEADLLSMAGLVLDGCFGGLGSSMDESAG